MPYPIAKLPYGLRCRLHDLSTPLERYDLQVAAGNPSICPPIQTVQNKVDMTLLCQDGTTTLYHAKSRHHQDYPMDISENSLVHGKFFDFFKTDSSYLTSPIFNNLLIRPKRLTFSSCDLGNNFFSILKPFVFHCTCVEVTDVTNLNFGHLVAAFPKLRKLIVESCPENWMAGLLPCSGRIGILELHFCNDLDDVSCNIKCDELLAFLKAQRRGFHLTLRCLRWQSGNNYFAELLSELNQLTPVSPERKKRHVIIIRDNLTEPDTFYLP